MKTWHLEYAVVGFLLACASYWGGNSLKEWLCAVAVLLEFGEATIVDRLIESRQSEEIRRHVSSLRKLLPYTVILMERAACPVSGVKMIEDPREFLVSVPNRYDGHPVHVILDPRFTPEGKVRFVLVIRD